MITPDKYLNLKSSLLNISAYSIRYLQKIQVVSYTELEISVERDLGEEAREVLPYALNFLYLLDKVEYKKEIDSIILKL